MKAPGKLHKHSENTFFRIYHKKYSDNTTLYFKCFDPKKYQAAPEKLDIRMQIDWTRVRTMCDQSYTLLLPP